MDNTHNEILEQISLICKENDWTLYKLSKEAGIQYSSLRNMFARNTYPNFTTLKKICNGLQIDLSTFFLYMEESSNRKNSSEIHIALSKEEKIIIEHFRNMNSKQKLLLRLYMSGLLDKNPKRP